MPSVSTYSTPRVSASPRSAPQPALLWLAVLALIACTILLYAPVNRFDFIALDDADYVADNPHVSSGLSWANTRWAFTTIHACNWHPLTWLSHQLDSSLYGPGPSGPHFTNLLFHAANAALLFLLLHQLTRSLWRSTAVAFLFALHPLRIESVAWISERKDVLSAFFFLLTLYCYSNYAKLRHVRWYCAAVLMFALGLLSKPMLVTLPCVLLLLDFWPLKRRASRALLIEKLPFFLLSAASCAITFFAQALGGAVHSLASLTFPQRLANAVIAYAQYLLKTAWPTDLAFYYPHPGHWPFVVVLGAVLLISVVSFLVLRHATARPFAVVGWLWFLGMLFPTLGLVQVGSQAFADRYTYLPSIGLFILVIWSLASLSQHRPRLRVAFISSSILSVVFFSLLTQRHLPRWRESETLFRHTLAVTHDNFAAHHSLGYTLLTQGKLDEAISEFQRALVLHPRFAEAHLNLGNALLQKGQPLAAIERYQHALALHPRLAQARYNLGTTFLQLGRLDEALAALLLAADAQPHSHWTQLNLGNVFLQKGDLARAVTHYQNALALLPDFADAHDNLSVAFVQLGRTDDAFHHLTAALTLAPHHPNALAHLGDLLLRTGRTAEAITYLQQAAALNPSDADAHLALAYALLNQRQISAAISHFETASKLQPDNFRPLAALAWILATCPDASLRDGPRAVSLAEHAARIAQSDDAVLLQTLAAAQAESGLFPQAISTAEKALALTTHPPDPSLANTLRSHLDAYHAHIPLRDSALQSVSTP